jgi:hypothetical protein
MSVHKPTNNKCLWKKFSVADLQFNHEESAWYGRKHASLFTSVNSTYIISTLDFWCVYPSWEMVSKIVYFEIFIICYIWQWFGKDQEDKGSHSLHKGIFVMRLKETWNDLSRESHSKCRLELRTHYKLDQITQQHN